MTTFTTVDTARSIMGKNMLGIEEVQKHFGVTYTQEQLHQLSQIPFSEETLQTYKDTHVLFAGAALSANEVVRCCERVGVHAIWEAYEDYPFTFRKMVSFRWYLLRKDPVPESYNKTYNTQCSLLTKKEDVPLVCEMTFMVMLYFHVNRERLLKRFYLRCEDSVSGSKVMIGSFGSDGLYVGDCNDIETSSDIGLASSVLPETN